MKSDPAAFAAASQSTNKGRGAKADDWQGVRFPFTNQLESVSSLFTGSGIYTSCGFDQALALGLSREPRLRSNDGI